MSNSGFRRHLLSVCAAALLVAGCGGAQLPVGAPGATHAVAADQVRAASSSGCTFNCCPPLAGGTGILPDGDFSQATNPGDQYPLYHRGQVFAPNWEVSKKNINLNGSTWANVDGLCNVDLDGTVPGVIKSSAISTKPGASYTLSFILSGNGYGPPTIKTMKVTIEKQFKEFTWNTYGGNDAENGDWKIVTWKFSVTRRLSVLNFASEDPKGSGFGAVIAGIALTEK
ncbi:MAG: DUF642 domain-containing protein [Candidatus Cybelea sp.]